MLSKISEAAYFINIASFLKFLHFFIADITTIFQSFRQQSTTTADDASYGHVWGFTKGVYLYLSYILIMYL